jgi:hypothetical protein
MFPLLEPNLDGLVVPKFRVSGGRIIHSSLDGLISWSINDLGPHRLVFDLSLRGFVLALLGRSSDSRR